MEDRRHGCGLSRHVVDVDTIDRELGPRLTNRITRELVTGDPLADRPSIQKRRQREAVFDFSQVRLEDLLYMIGRFSPQYSMSTPIFRPNERLHSNDGGATHSCPPAGAREDSWTQLPSDK